MRVDRWFRHVLDEDFSGALCANGLHDPELWTGDRDSMTKEQWRANRRQAQAICQMCPALQQCARYAIKHPELQGVWGGMLDEQRSELRKRVSPVR